ncbi:RagB/SusD family nutrient uptake outer membrane protein [Bacteroides sp. UBA939]|uniref:RagB/SusD family nutrient uptake outer membrane protein n=1 Tax=Bacteroides sp. UBA939 TaxID=1946092 RepID=UPI0025C3A904|nr:RagB/SusD family nutrient uptake outer membrane protein [Bacteroides sp. UBA939]
MNLKKIYITILSGVVCLSLGSCTDFLDTSSKTLLFDDNYYKSVEDAEMALVGCYDGWQRVTSDGGFAFYIVSEVMSDNCFGATGNGDGRGYQVVDRFDILESPADANIFETTWKSYYAGIFRCNTLLARLDQIVWKEGDVDTRNRIEGETRALRALMYFEMVRLWENIPLLLQPTVDNVPQANPDDVYATIVEDFLYAANHIPADTYPKAEAAQNDGRITCYAAKAFLARVYLYYTGYYGKELAGVSKSGVLQGLEDVITSNEYDLVDEYKNLWEPASSTPVDGEYRFESTYAGRGNIETVLALKFNDTSDYNGNNDGNSWLVMTGMRNTNWSPYGKGWGACTVHPALMQAYEAGDTRRAASIIDIVNEGIYETFDVADQREYTGYTIKKYTPMAYYDGTSATKGGAGDFQTAQSQDYVVMRYADVLLMAAELGSVNAQRYFDSVRARAGLGSKPVNQANLLAERRVEFALEGIRYWDLLRQGIDVAAATIAEESGVPVLSGGVNDKVIIKADNIKKTRGLIQIPNNQITLSEGVLIQNPGW